MLEMRLSREGVNAQGVSPMTRRACIADNMYYFCKYTIVQALTVFVWEREREENIRLHWVTVGISITHHEIPTSLSVYSSSTGVRHSLSSHQNNAKLSATVEGSQTRQAPPWGRKGSVPLAIVNRAFLFSFYVRGGRWPRATWIMRIKGPLNCLSPETSIELEESQREMSWYHPLK